VPDCRRSRGILRPKRDFRARESCRTGSIQGNAMKKIIAVAALVAAGFAAPTTAVQAASAYPANCLVLPLLQAECRDIIRDNIGSTSTAVASATVAAASVADVNRPKVPYAAWWTCERAPDGTKAILTCDY